jgi:hypothetical protein
MQHLRRRVGDEAFARVRKTLGADALRPSTARCARAQDEETFFVPQRIHLILSLSKDAPWIFSGLLAPFRFSSLIRRSADLRSRVDLKVRLQPSALTDQPFAEVVAGRQRRQSEFNELSIGRNAHTRPLAFEKARFERAAQSADRA